MAASCSRYGGAGAAITPVTCGQRRSGRAVHVHGDGVCPPGFDVVRRNDRGTPTGAVDLHYTVTCRIGHSNARDAELLGDGCAAGDATASRSRRCRAGDCAGDDDGFGRRGRTVHVHARDCRRAIIFRSGGTDSGHADGKRDLQLHGDDHRSAGHNGTLNCCVTVHRRPARRASLSMRCRACQSRR